MSEPKTAGDAVDVTSLLLLLLRHPREIVEHQPQPVPRDQFLRSAGDLLLEIARRACLAVSDFAEPRWSADDRITLARIDESLRLDLSLDATPISLAPVEAPGKAIQLWDARVSAHTLAPIPHSVLSHAGATPKMQLLHFLDGKSLRRFAHYVAYLARHPQAREHEVECNGPDFGLLLEHARAKQAAIDDVLGSQFRPTPLLHA